MDVERTKAALDCVTATLRRELLVHSKWVLEALYGGDPDLWGRAELLCLRAGLSHEDVLLAEANRAR